MKQSLETTPPNASPSLLVPDRRPSFQWVCPADAAEIVGLSRSTLAKMRLRGDGPHYAKISKAVRYNVDVLEAWMRASTVGSTSQYRVD